jgi:alanine-glyoxylate transaminase/serine-glyoxylate transaminase/serine-pyruvate transaminase
VDEWGIDICYSGTQKCLSCPPGLAPVTFSPKAIERLKARASKCKSWYLDLNLIQSYWGSDRVYHHTAPVSMNYALREALLLILEEGMEQRWDRHRRNHQALVAGISALGLSMHVAPEYRLWSLNTVNIPEGVDDIKVRQQLLEEFCLEIGGGLGELKGKVWRVGLMGDNSRPHNVLYFLFSLEKCMKCQGFQCDPGAGVRAAAEHYSQS